MGYRWGNLLFAYMCVGSMMTECVWAHVYKHNCECACGSQKLMSFHYSLPYILKQCLSLIPEFTILTTLISLPQRFPASVTLATEIK